MWIEIPPIENHRRFSKVARPFQYIVAVSESTGESDFVRFIEDPTKLHNTKVEQTLSSELFSVLEGENLPSYTARPDISDYKRPMTPEELIDFFEDIESKLEEPGLNDLQSALQIGLRSNREVAERQIKTHLETYRFLRYFDIYPHDTRIHALMALGPDRLRSHSPEYLKAFQEFLVVYGTHSGIGADILPYVHRNILDSMEVVFRYAREMFMRFPEADKTQYKLALRRALNLITMGNPIPPPLQVTLDEREIPEFKPEMGIPVLRSSYK